mgnify:CR=1 FL=1
MNLKIFLNITGLVTLISCCAPKETTQEQQPPMTQQEVQEALIERNRAFLKQERENINAYADSSESTFLQTGSGLYYSILSAGNDSISIKEGDLVEYEYEISKLEKERDANLEDLKYKLLLFRDEKEKLFDIVENIELTTWIEI